MISLYTIFGNNNNLQIIRLIVFWFEFYSLRGMIILSQKLIKQLKIQIKKYIKQKYIQNLNKTIEKYSFKEQTKNKCFILRHVFLNIYID